MIGVKTMERPQEWTPETLAALYRLAAENIRAHGLAKNTFMDRTTGAMCAVGAMSASVGDTGFGVICYDRQALHPLAVALNSEIEEDWAFGAIASWNDAPQRHAEEVAAKLEEVAAGLLEQAAELEKVTLS